MCSNYVGSSNRILNEFEFGSLKPASRSVNRNYEWKLHWIVKTFDETVPFALSLARTVCVEIKIFKNDECWIRRSESFSIYFNCWSRWTSSMSNRIHEFVDKNLMCARDVISWWITSSVCCRLVNGMHALVRCLYCEPFYCYPYAEQAVRFVAFCILSMRSMWPMRTIREGVLPIFFMDFLQSTAMIWYKLTESPTKYTHTHEIKFIFFHFFPRTQWKLFEQNYWCLFFGKFQWKDHNIVTNKH